MAIIINADDTVSVQKKTAKGLSGIMASSTTEQVNALDRLELIAVVWAVKANPFPLGAGEKVYRAMLDAVRERDAIDPIGANLTLGQIRQSLAIRASQGCNAPNDSYLRIAYQIKTNKTVSGY